ncbi:MAG: BCCT family transporter [Hespellia sp.]|nr:BCCT family transporter [Hespellia sp.]
MRNKSKIRHIAFWPAFILLLGALIYSIVDREGFYAMASVANSWVLENLGWTYSLTSFLCLATIVVVYISPLGDVVLGGKNAKPILSKVNWATITLCTAMAAGALFWGITEPIYHMAAPPVGIEPNSWESAKFAMETMVLHWSIHPYAIYTLPVIAFAFAFFNMRKPFSVTSQLSVIADKFHIKIGDKNVLPQILDAVLLFAMGLGIMGTLCTGTLNMGGALKEITGLQSKSAAWLIILVGVTICFVLSSISGIQKGIKLLSNVNVAVYLILLAIMFLLGPTAFQIDGTIEAIGGTLSRLPEKLLTTGAYASDPWAKSWTVFYAGSWASWAPISACFLARLGVGYKVKDLIKINFGIPILFNIVWCGIFSNTAINYQLTGKLDLIHILNTEGPEATIYAIFREMPGAKLIIILFFIALLISMITAMDSTTNSIAAISTTGISPEEQESSVFLKIIWGIMFSASSYIMLTIAGIDGIKLLSNLGGLPNIFIIFGGIVCVWIIAGNVKKYNIVDKNLEEADSEKNSE